MKCSLTSLVLECTYSLLSSSLLSFLLSVHKSYCVTYHPSIRPSNNLSTLLLLRTSQSKQRTTHTHEHHPRPTQPIMTDHHRWHDTPLPAPQRLSQPFWVSGYSEQPPQIGGGGGSGYGWQPETGIVDNRLVWAYQQHQHQHQERGHGCHVEEGYGLEVSVCVDLMPCMRAFHIDGLLIILYYINFLGFGLDLD